MGGLQQVAEGLAGPNPRVSRMPVWEGQNNDFVRNDSVSIAFSAGACCLHFFFFMESSNKRKTVMVST